MAFNLIKTDLVIANKFLPFLILLSK